MESSERGFHFSQSKSLAAFIPFTNRESQKMVQSDWKKFEFKRYINSHARKSDFSPTTDFKKQFLCW